LAVPERLAVEMALHEEQERRALEGELAVLAERWRAAEEIAAIADSLAVPASVEQRLEDLKTNRWPPRGTPSMRFASPAVAGLILVALASAADAQRDDVYSGVGVAFGIGRGSMDIQCQGCETSAQADISALFRV